MQAAARRMREFVGGLLARPDELMLEVGASGELLLARLRVAIAALLLLLPLANALGGGRVEETLIGLAGAVAVNLLAQLWLALAKRHRRYPWLPYASGAWDVTATTLVLLSLAFHHLPAALNSMVVWCGYALAIMAGALRNDGRVTLFVGGLALLQYASLVWIVFAAATSPEHLISSDYGTVALSTQIQRLLLLVAFTLITLILTYRMQRLVEMSGTDGLTGLPNRAWLLHRFPRMLEAAREEGASLSVAMIDLDRFRLVNEELGRRVGDRALQHVVAAIRGQLEDGEELVRLGGEEFALLLRKPLGTAWERVEFLRRNVAARHFDHDLRSEPLALTFSAGLACYPNDADTPSALLRRADQRLDAAKRHGRNRVLARDV
jgi:diguanylate cyclase (GGDEF)-like protein